MRIDAQFVDVGVRRVLVRHAGRGPALVLVHQSPQSSQALLPWIEELAERFAVFAPDTPGFGHSDPLALAQPTIPDLAAALGRLLQALDLGPVLLYGVHTGAAIAARLARDAPQQVAALVCDGLSAFTADERQPLLEGYLPPFEPAWDATHLLWLWARIREQRLFFPWHVGTKSARLALPVTPTEQIHADVMDVLCAGDGYRAGYRAPLLYEHGAAGAAQITVPAWFLYRRADVLRAHMERLPALPANVRSREVADADELLQQMVVAFADVGAGLAQIDAGQQVHAAASADHRIAAGPSGALAWRRAGPLANRAVVLIPDLGTAACVPDDRAPGEQAFALDWPGHGASFGWTQAPGLEALAEQALAALESLGLKRVALRGQGAGAALAVLIARRLGARCESLHLVDPLPLTAGERATFLAGLPDPAPHDTGAHLIAAWNWARAKHLFWPWRASDAQAAILAAAPPPRRVHADVVEMLRAGALLPGLWREALLLDLPTLVAAISVPLRVSSSSDHPERMRMAQRLASPSPCEGEGRGGG